MTEQDSVITQSEVVQVLRETWERQQEVVRASRTLVQVRTTELQCWVEHWLDGKCEQEAKDSLAAYNALVDVFNRQ
jgi:hypothetical protein